MPFGSKALDEAAAIAAARAAEALWQASDAGRLTVVTDASPCAGTLQKAVVEALAATGRRLRVMDFVTFWAAEGLPRVGEARRPGRAVLHPACTLVRAGGLPDLLKVARAHAESV